MKKHSLLFVTVLVCGSLASSLTAADPLYRLIGKDGDGTSVPLVPFFSGLATDAGLAFSNRAPQAGNILLPRLWHKTDTIGAIAVAACRLAGDVVFKVEKNTFILAPAGTEQSIADQLAGNHVDRPLETGDVVLSMSPGIILGTSIELSSKATSGGSPSVGMGPPCLRAEWFFERNWSVALGMQSLQVYTSGTTDGDRRAEFTYWSTGIDFWINPQRDIGLLGDFAPFGALDIGVGLTVGMLVDSGSDGDYYALPGDPASALTDANPVITLHVAISLHIVDGFFLRFDWYAGRIQKMFSFPDIINMINPGLALRF